MRLYYHHLAGDINKVSLNIVAFFVKTILAKNTIISVSGKI